MFIELTEDQKMLQQAVRAFSRDRILPKAAEFDSQSKIPAEIISEIAQMGLMGVCVPEQWDGANLDAVSYVIAIEELSAACASTGVTASVNNSLVADPLLKFGTDAQKERWLKPLARGDINGCFALSEPGTGSDAANQQTVCTRDGDGWIIDGTKNFITNGPIADVCIVFTMSDKSLGYKGITAFVVGMDTPGVSCGPKEHKMGIKGSPCSSVIFDNCKVGPDALLGEVGKGFKVAMTTLDGGRIGVAAQGIGIARQAYEEALQYSTERKAFGSSLSELQAIQHMLADMATEIDAARLLTYRAATLKGKGERFTKEAAMAKLYSGEMATRVTHKALQVHGGYGFLEDFNAARHYRDARICEIYEGTNEIQRLVISANTLKELAS